MGLCQNMDNAVLTHPHPYLKITLSGLYIIWVVYRYKPKYRRQRKAHDR